MSGATQKNKKYAPLLLAVIVAAVVIVAVIFLRSHNVAVLNPKGQVASSERRLMIYASLLAILIIVPVFAMTIGIVWKYRATNTNATYSPDWDHNRTAETAWWLIPFAIITVLSVITWRSTHQLDPAKTLHSDTPPLTIQVVALQWKWLFIYPQEGIATVNYIKFPEKTPISFEITSDAPMNSFWIPQLGGQMYAMSGMSMPLHLEANETGDYRGLSANISGEGFSKMKFMAHSVTTDDFRQWVGQVRTSSNYLNLDSYNLLSRPSQDDPLSDYYMTDNSLYNTIVSKFTDPTHKIPDALVHTHDESEH